MGLPTIDAYPLPRPGDYPANRVDWQLDPTRAAVLVHDLQRHFIDVFPGGLGCPAAAAIANITTLRDAADRAGVPVVYTAQPPDQHPADRGLLTDFWGPGLADAGTARIVEPLTPRAHDTVLTKWRYNAFIRTDLLALLQAWGRDQLVLVGVYAHIGCLLTAADAFMHDVQPFVVADAVADFTREDHVQALAYAAQRCGCVLTTAQVGDALLAGGAARREPTEAVGGRR